MPDCQSEAGFDTKKAALSNDAVNKGSIKEYNEYKHVISIKELMIFSHMLID